MEWSVYQPKRRKHSEEQVTITKNRSLIINRAATERMKAGKFKYVRLRYKPDGTIAVQPMQEKEAKTLKLHFAPKGNVATISASGLLEEMRYHKNQPKERHDLVWNEKEKWFEFSIPRDKLHGRRRSKRRKKIN